MSCKFETLQQCPVYNMYSIVIYWISQPPKLVKQHIIIKASLGRTPWNIHSYRTETLPLTLSVEFHKGLSAPHFLLPKDRSYWLCFPQVHAIIGNQSIVEMSSQHSDLGLCPQLLLRADWYNKGLNEEIFCSFDKTATKGTAHYIVQCPQRISHILCFSQGSKQEKMFSLLMIFFGLFLVI